MNFLLNTSTNNDYTVLIVLAICAVVAIGYYLLKNKSAGSKNTGSNDYPAESVEEVSTVASDNDGEIIAVITAAIAMAESESDGLKFRVVSFKRK